MKHIFDRQSLEVKQDNLHTNFYSHHILVCLDKKRKPFVDCQNISGRSKKCIIFQSKITFKEDKHTIF